MLTEKTKVVDYVISKLVLDPTVQLREGLNRQAILDYAEAMAAGDEFPAIVVFSRYGDKAYVADGFHRVRAAQKAGLKKIKAEVRDGSRRDAILYAARCNNRHGVRRSNDDKRKAVITLLKDAEWRKWADAEIARACGVSGGMVAKYREWLQPGKDATAQEVRTYIDRSGRERTYTVDPELREEKRKLNETRMKTDYCPYCGQPLKTRQTAKNT